MPRNAAAVRNFEPVAQQARADNSARNIPHDFTRDIYGLLGIPIDVTSMRNVVHHIETAAASATPLLISTANVNFLTTSRNDKEFRESLMSSDICTADGMPIVWLSRLLGIPIKDRVAGSDLFDVLRSTRSSGPLKVFLFGGANGVAEKAAAILNEQNAGVICTGAFFPGYGTVEEMSSDAIINMINASKADCLVVALGARKGNLWLQHNHDRLTIPIRAQLGATVNFQAGTIKRAPLRMQKWGLEWLFRIKEEPRLWRRYLVDGMGLLGLMVTHVLPLVILTQWHRLLWGQTDDIEIQRFEGPNLVSLTISGAATTWNFEKAAPYLLNAAAADKNVVINFAKTRQIDARFIGLLLMLQKRLKEQRAADAPHVRASPAQAVDSA